MGLPRATAGASRDRVHEYWTRPDDGHNQPASYAAVDPARSDALGKVFDRFVPKSASILEIGCNVGRNLHYLREAGYSDLSGIEISQDAIAEMETRFPQVRSSCRIINSSVEGCVAELPSFDAIFSMAVFVHIHPDSDWVFSAIAAKARRTVITVEQEHSSGDSWRHFGRDYRRIFEHCGFRQIHIARPVPGLPKSYVLRVFERESGASRWLRRFRRFFGRN